MFPTRKTILNVAAVSILSSLAVIQVVACSDNSGGDTKLVIPRPDGGTGGSSTGSGGDPTGAGGGDPTGTGGATTGTAGSGGATTGTGGSATGGTGGSNGGAGGSNGGTGGSQEGGITDAGSNVCVASGSYDNSSLPLLPDGGLPPL